ncbi:MAG: gliding motility-associated C-terminal domain-containing protein [Cytophagaceae bacterium]
MLKRVLKFVSVLLVGSVGVFTSQAQNLQISGGNAHTVAICENGDIFAWGINNRGQLGPGAGGGFSNTPVLVTGFPLGLDIRQTDAGSGSHTLALGCDGSVYAWGENTYGQLGNGTSGSFSATPVRVVGIGGAGFLTGVKYVSGGNDESFAIMNDGRVVSWGQNDKGQLGNNTTTDRSFPNYVLKCDGTPLTNVIQVEAGDENGYALLADGTVWSWGDNADNSGAALGRPTTNNRCAQQVVYGNTTDNGFTTTPVTNIKSISAGDRHILLLDNTGNVWSAGGDWGNGQLGQGQGYQLSLHRVLAPGGTCNTSNEYNTGPYLSNVVSISAGQAHSMAVLADGRVVTWGANGFYDCGTGCTTAGGQLGIGSTTFTAAGGVECPVYGMTSAGVQVTNAVSVSDGDAVSIVVLANGQILMAGSNKYGQLGIGTGGGASGAGDVSATGYRSYFTAVTIPTCTFAVECPPKPNMGADVEICEGTSLTLYANVPPRTPYNYSWEYSATGTAPWTVLKNVTTIPTANADNLVTTANGYYRIIISDDRASLPANCAPCSAVGDTLRRFPPTANFGDPGNLTFCGTTATVRVTETGASATSTGSTYEWYATQTGGTALATSTDIATTTLNVTTLAKTGTAPTRVATAWVEDKSTFNTVLAPKAPMGLGNQQTYGPRRINFSTLKSMSINSVTVEWISYSTSPLTLTLRDAGGTALATGSFTPPGSGNFTTTITFTTTPQLAAGSYYIESNQDTRQYNTPGNAYTTVYAYSGVNLLDFISYGTGTATDIFPPFYDWNVTVGSPYPCGRIPVLIQEDCPPCSKPTAVSITTPASTPVTICQGTAQNLIGSVTVGAAAQNTNFTYSWRKVLPTPVTVPVAPTVIAIPVGTPTATPAFALTGALADAGTYTLRVEDGSAGSATCYTEASVVVVVNPTTTPGVVAADQTICTGGDPAAFTVTTPAAGGNGTTYAYQWEQSINGGTTWTDIATAGTSATYDPGVLTNATTANTTVQYRRKVTSGVCPQVTSNAITVTINPALVAGVVAADQTICSGGDPAAFTVTTAPTGGTGTYTYQWQSATALAGPYSDIASATNATYDAPTGLTTTTYYRRVDKSGTCANQNTNVITVTVPSALVAGTVGTAQTICYNTIPAAFTSTAAASGGVGPYNYQWQSSADNITFVDIAGATTATYTPSAAITANTYYRRRVTSGNPTGCNTGQTASVLVTVSADLTSGAIGSDQTICSGATPALFTNTTTPTGGQTPFTYVWQVSNDGGATYANLPSSNSATYSSPALTNPTASPITVLLRREVTSSGGCGSKQTLPVTVTVNPTLVPAITIAANNTTICAGTQIDFTSTPTNPGAGPTYQWKKNGSNIAGATNATYSTTTAANNDSYTLTMTSNATCASPTSVTSAAIVITVTTVVTPTVTLAADKTTICPGETVNFTATGGNGGTSPTYEFFVGATSQGAASTVNTFASSSLANGASVTVRMVSNSGCASTPNATSNAVVITVTPTVTPTVSVTANPGTSICSGQAVSFSLTSTNTGTNPAYQWKVDGTNVVGQTNTTFSPATVGNNSVISVEMTVTQVSGTYCPSASPVSGQVTMSVSPPVTAGTIGGATSICSGTSPGVLNETAPTTGGSGTYTYKWQSSPDNSAWTDITPAATNATYTPPSLTATTYFRRVDGSGSCATANTNSVTIIVLPGMTPGAISIATSSICYNTIPGVISTTTAPTGGTGTYSFTWEVSPDNGTTWTVIPGETGSTLTSTVPLTSGVQVRKVINDGSTGGCNISYTTPVTITVAAQFTPGSIGSDQTVCASATISPLTETTAAAGGLGTNTYKWEQSIDGGTTWSVVLGATGTGYNPGSLTATTTYRRLVSNTCGTDLQSNVVTITVTPNVPVSIVLNDPGAACAASPITFNSSPVNEGTTPTYTWTVNGANQGVNAPTFTSSSLNNGDVVQVSVVSSLTCKTGSPATSNTVTVQVTGNVTPSVTISDPGPICVGGAAFFQATPTSGGATPSYAWFVNGVPVGSNQDSYLDANFNNGDQVYVVMTSSFACAVPASATSNTRTMDVRPIPTPSINELDATICSGQSVVYTANFTAGNTLRWNKNGGPINGQTGSSLTVTQSGTYSITESNGACATTSAVVIVNVIPTPIANAGPDMVVLENDVVSLNGSGGAVYSWSPATGLSSTTIANPTFTASQTVTYTLTVSDPTLQCSTTDDVTIIVERPIRIPNAITVNHDGQNDVWDIENMSSFPNAIVEVYNRWGTLVWKSVGYDKMWDGTNYRNGEVLPDGTYFYIIILNSTKFPDPYKGYIQVIK